MILCIGHSHITALQAAAQLGLVDTGSFRMRFAPLSKESLAAVPTPKRFERYVEDLVLSLAPEERSPELLVSTIGGNSHNGLGLIEHERPFDFVLEDAPELPLDEGAELVPGVVVEKLIAARLAPFLAIKKKILGRFDCRKMHVQSPPPLGDGEYMAAHLDPIFRSERPIKIASRPLRLKLWLLHSRLVRRFCEQEGIELIECPPEGCEEGSLFLKREFYPANATHANKLYGALVIKQVLTAAVAPRPAPRSAAPTRISTSPLRRSENPYDAAPDSAFWARAVAGVPTRSIAPLVEFPFPVSRSDKVATAGSCFAQHLARHLAASGFNYFVAETPHPFMDAKNAEAEGYGVFSARFGNIYTSRQLLQLVRRAYGEFTPLDNAWSEPDGRYVDPYRPNIRPGGFFTLEHLERDRASHLAAVRKMVEESDVFVFTLGLTECWENVSDSAVYPLCPGVAGGHFDPAVHRFRNLSVEEVVDDLETTLALFERRNPRIRMILTVSPVPLKATASDRHVLSATTYSKSVLRVAAETLARGHRNVAYFPSYEIITMSASRGRYFADDLRSISEEGVSHVMRVFLEKAAGQPGQERMTVAASGMGGGPALDDAFLRKMDEVVDVICEEELLDARRASGAGSETPSVGRR